MPKVTDSKQQSWNLNSGNWLSDPVLIARMHQIWAGWGMNAISRQLWASQVALVVKNPPANAGDEMWVRSLGLEDPLEEGMAAHSSILA